MMRRRKLFILFHGRFPSEKAAALFVAENARSFSSTFDVCIIAPRRLGRIRKDAREAYGFTENMKVVYLPVLDLFYAPFLSFVAFYISMLTYLPFATAYLGFMARPGDSVISNDFLLALAATYTHAKVVFEVHDYPEHWKRTYALMFRRAALVIATNEWKKRALQAEFPDIDSVLVMERNAVDFERFGALKSRTDCRKSIRLPENHKIAVYTGHLYNWKGIETLIEAARTMPEVLFLFVGGTVEEKTRYATENAAYKNIRFTGHVPHGEVADWQGAADVLVLPNTAREEISAHYTSPMKLFEYMASGRPIVASRIPSIEEMLDESTAYLFTPDDPESLREALESALSDPDESNLRAVRSLARVREHSWEARAKRLKALAPLRDTNCTV